MESGMHKRATTVLVVGFVAILVGALLAATAWKPVQATPGDPMWVLVELSIVFGVAAMIPARDPRAYRLRETTSAIHAK
jgi:hypothetical protein